MNNLTNDQIAEIVLNDRKYARPDGGFHQGLIRALGVDSKRAQAIAKLAREIAQERATTKLLATVPQVTEPAPAVEPAPAPVPVEAPAVQDVPIVYNHEQPVAPQPPANEVVFGADVEGAHVAQARSLAESALRLAHKGDWYGYKKTRQEGEKLTKTGRMPELFYAALDHFRKTVELQVQQLIDAGKFADARDLLERERIKAGFSEKLFSTKYKAITAALAPATEQPKAQPKVQPKVQPAPKAKAVPQASQAAQAPALVPAPEVAPVSVQPAPAPVPVAPTVGAPTISLDAIVAAAKRGELKANTAKLVLYDMIETTLKGVE